MSNIERCDCADKPTDQARAVEWGLRAAKWEQTAGEERDRADRAERQLRGAVRDLREFQEELTKALNDHGVPAMPSWREAIDWLANQDRRTG